MTEEKLHHADGEINCANCARPVTPTRAKRVRSADKYGFTDDPLFCSLVCADIWHDKHLDICDV